MPDNWSNAWEGAWADFQVPPPVLKSKTPPDLAAIQARHGAWMDAIVAEFERNLTAIVDAAERATSAYLEDHLTLTAEGAIEQTPANMKVLRTLNDVFMENMNAAGYRQLLEDFTAKFPEQFSYLQETLDYLSSTMDNPLPPVDFSAEDLSLLDSFQLSAAGQLETGMEAAAGSAMSQVMFSVGGLPFKELTATIAEQFELSIAKARSLAETAVSTFFRTMTDQAFQVIEKDLKQEVIRYRYAGPLDKLTRPFCHRLMQRDRAYTREEIAQMDNGSLPNVLVSAGGWNCRHVWLLDTRALALREAA